MPEPSRLHGLDTLRAIAILAVMLYHLTIFGELTIRLLPITYFGWMGVDLFFVLSGFLIGQQLLKPYLRGTSPSIADFYLRRAFRILPCYLAVLALYFLVPAWREFPVLPPLWKFLTFTMNFGFSFSSRSFSNAWYLCVEEHFYLLLPLLVVLLMRRPSTLKTITLLLLLIASGIALRAYLIAHFPDDIWEKIYYPSWTRFDGLVFGVTLALIRTFRPHWWQHAAIRGHTLLLTGLGCIATVLYLFRNEDLGNNTGPAKWGVVLGFPLLAFGLTLITASALTTNGLLARWRIPGTKAIATLAFTLYLTHKPVAHLVMVHVPSITHAKGPASWLLYAVTCAAAALVLHLAIERPFLRLRDRTSRRQSSTGLEREMRTDPAL